MYLFTFAYRYLNDEKIKGLVEEHIVANSIQDALKYWAIDLRDEEIEFHSITRQVPVLAVPPLHERGVIDRLEKIEDRPDGNKSD